MISCFVGAALVLLEQATKRAARARPSRKTADRRMRDRKEFRRGNRGKGCCGRAARVRRLHSFGGS